MSSFPAFSSFCNSPPIFQCILRGVAQEDGVLRKTDDLIAGCLRARYGMATSSGKTVLKVLDLDEEDADILNRCGL